MSVRLLHAAAICCLLTPALALAQQHAVPYPRVDNAAGYRVDPGWPLDAPPEGEWTAPMSSVAVAPDGSIWTLNRGTIPVQVYSPEGRLLKHWGEGMFQNAHSVRFDREGGLWIIDTLSHTVRKFSPDGEVLMTLGTLDEAGEDEAHMNQPNDVAFAPNGDIYVSDGYGNDRVVVFDRNGRFIRAWGRLGTGQGELSQPHAIAVDSQSRVYVADRNNARVQIFDARGDFLAEWKNIVTPWHIVITEDDDVYICGSSPKLWSEVSERGSMLATPPKDQLLMRLDTEGRLKQLWVFPMGSEPGELNWVHGMDIAPDGALYVGDVQGRRAQKFLPVGAAGSGL